MKDYNGFSAEFRSSAYNKQKASGLVQRMRGLKCCICGGGPGPGMMGHTENYHDLQDMRPVCVECHMKLHSRFSRPGVWINHLLALRDGYIPIQWVSVGAYFQQQKLHDEGYHTDVAGEDPSRIGNQWFHQLKMYKIDLFTQKAAS